MIYEIKLLNLDILRPDKPNIVFENGTRAKIVMYLYDRNIESGDDIVIKEYYPSRHD